MTGTLASRIAGAVSALGVMLLLAGCDELQTPTSLPDLGAVVEEIAGAALDEALTAADDALTGHAPEQPPGEGQGAGEHAVVVRVIDGDTIVVARDGVESRVRLMNVQAPEVARGGRAGDCGGIEAAAWLTDTLPAGAVVELVHDLQRYDRFDREIAGVLVDGRLINAELAAAGWATPARFGVNAKFYDDVAAATETARAAGLGIHDEAACPR